MAGVQYNPSGPAPQNSQPYPAYMAPGNSRLSHPIQGLDPLNQFSNQYQNNSGTYISSTTGTIPVPMTSVVMPHSSQGQMTGYIPGVLSMPSHNPAVNPWIFNQNLGTVNN